HFDRFGATLVAGGWRPLRELTATWQGRLVRNAGESRGPLRPRRFGQLERSERPLRGASVCSAHLSLRASKILDSVGGAACIARRASRVLAVRRCASGAAIAYGRDVVPDGPHTRGSILSSATPRTWDGVGCGPGVPGARAGLRRRGARKINAG